MKFFNSERRFSSLFQFFGIATMSAVVSCLILATGSFSKASSTAKATDDDPFSKLVQVYQNCLIPGSLCGPALISEMQGNILEAKKIKGLVDLPTYCDQMENLLNEQVRFAEEQTDYSVKSSLYLKQIKLKAVCSSKKK